MNVFEVQRDADPSIRTGIADLLIQQPINTNTQKNFDFILNGINLALESEHHAYLVVAEKDNAIVGVAFFNIGISLPKGGSYMWLNELFVQEDLRNQGIARKLLLHVIHWAENNGIRSIELETGINNSVTKHIYNSLGFYEIVSNRYGFSF
ncbi:GNAT family N-acetyltransferase [Pseudalkalibacillus decolorationis]|uniref:GNAT family N-acetyltransferase n=1 Tax=Pseudalkalibacillus decolorationis TaxID=163879 RepID=UPI0027E2993C|nr:GNAT family N-acetyltransferase [Pseudalkalibacillus decolorationis]